MNILDHKKSCYLNSLNGFVSQSDSFVFINYKGMDSVKVNQFRDRSYEAGLLPKVVKNTIFKIALKGSGYNIECDYFNNPSMILFSNLGPVILSKFIFNVCKDLELDIQGGYVDGNLCNIDYFKDISDMPGDLKGLLGVFTSSLKNPICNVVRTINKPVCDLVNVLNNITTCK